MRRSWVGLRWWQNDWGIARGEERANGGWGLGGKETRLLRKNGRKSAWVRSRRASMKLAEQDSGTVAVALVLRRTDAKGGGWRRRRFSLI
jgi:hypothetical protein